MERSYPLAPSGMTQRLAGGGQAAWLRLNAGARASLATLAFRWLVVACMGATVLITWPLWGVHESPPMLPAVALPAVALGWPLLGSLAVILVAPVVGMALHTALVLYAVLIDQTRLQPEVVSLLFLLWGTLPHATAKALARAHLVSLWAFAGVNKLFSPAFLDETAPRLIGGLIDEPPARLLANAGYLIAATELGTGLLALVPRTRRLAAVVAFGLHTGILVDLSPLGLDRNEAVWPWNVALAFAGFALIWPWRESPWRTLLGCHRGVRPLLLLLVVAPAGFYVGITDAYLAHNLYSSNTASATSTSLPPSETWIAFKVPLPPEHRLFKQYFHATCGPGDRMVITDTRWWYRRRGQDHVVLRCPPERRGDASTADD